jgi:uncharacterized OsmC-like protein
MAEALRVAKSGKDAKFGGRPKIGTSRIDITRKVQKTFEVVLRTEDKTFQFLIDEPEARGGRSEGPNPLSLFVTGAGS